ncbi:hypothetical protein ACXR0O_28175 [Verrucomicrobiota bacterium sgz303538]
MKTGPIESITMAAIALLPLTAATSEVFDSPGPGYRQQVEQLTSKKRSTDIHFNIAPPELRQAPDLSTLSSSFSTPIRLFETSAARKTPTPTVEKKDTQRP